MKKPGASRARASFWLICRTAALGFLFFVRLAAGPNAKRGSVAPFPLVPGRQVHAHYAARRGCGSRARGGTPCTCGPTRTGTDRCGAPSGGAGGSRTPRPRPTAAPRRRDRRRRLVVALRLHAGLDEQPQRAGCVATIGAEPGQIDQRRTMPAGAVDGRLQQLDRRGRLAGRSSTRACNHACPIDGAPPTERHRPVPPAPPWCALTPELLPRRRSDLAIVERSHHARPGQVSRVRRRCRRRRGTRPAGRPAPDRARTRCPSRLRVCHTWSASQSNPSAAMSPLRSTRPAAAYRSLNGGIGSLRNAAAVDEQRLVDRALPGRRIATPSGIGTASNERWASSSRTARSNPARIAAIWAAVATGGPSSGDQRNAPPTTSTRAQPPDQPVEPTVRAQHHIRVAAVQHPAVRLQHTEPLPVAVDELDVVADQPPAQRRELRVHPHEPLRPIVGVDPHRPRRALHQRRHEHEPVGHLRERGIQLQQPIQVVTPDRSIPRRPQPRPQLGQRRRSAAERRDDGVAERLSVARAMTTMMPEPGRQGGQATSGITSAASRSICLASSDDGVEEDHLGRTTTANAASGTAWLHRWTHVRPERPCRSGRRF